MITTKGLAEESANIICRLMDVLEELAPEWYSSADLIMEGEDYIVALEKQKLI